MTRSFYIAIVVAFLVLTGIFYWLDASFDGYKFMVLMIGNIIMALLSVITFTIATKQVSSQPNAFVRGVYGSSFLKLFVCMVAIVTYAILNKENIHKPSLFVLFGIYAVYSVIETMQLSKLARKVK